MYFVTAPLGRHRYTFSGKEDIPQQSTMISEDTADYRKAEENYIEILGEYLTYITRTPRNNRFPIPGQMGQESAGYVPAEEDLSIITPEKIEREAEIPYRTFEHEDTDSREIPDEPFETPEDMQDIQEEVPGTVQKTKREKKKREKEQKKAERAEKKKQSRISRMEQKKVGNIPENTPEFVSDTRSALTLEGSGEKKNPARRKRKASKNLENTDISQLKEEGRKKMKPAKKKFSIYDEVIDEEKVEQDKVDKMINQDGYYDGIAPIDETTKLEIKKKMDNTKVAVICLLGVTAAGLITAMVLVLSSMF